MSTSRVPQNPDPNLNRRITPEIIQAHALHQDEYELITHALGRYPSLTELGMFSVLWSERCSYKNTKALLRQLPTSKEVCAGSFGKVLIKAGEDNAGAVDIGDGWAVIFRIESHNHASAVDPFEGAASGVGGTVRDVLSMGARPVFLTNSLRIGDLASAASRSLLKGVVSGLGHYAGGLGLPNVGGDLYFDSCYEGRPIVNVLCMGLVRHESLLGGRAPGVGNRVYYVGAPTGRDSVGAALLGSQPLASHEQKPPVQKGDPVLGRRLVEACLKAAQAKDLVLGMQDLGSAGLAAAAAIAASRSGTGIDLDLDAVPQRDAGMNSYELLLSETQERMLLVVTQGREAELEALFRDADLKVAKIGVVTDSGFLSVSHKGSLVADVPIADLVGRAPTYIRDSMIPSYFAETSTWTPETAGIRDIDENAARDILPKLLAHPTIASKRWVARHFDQKAVPGVKVERGSDAAVVRLSLGDTERIIAVSNDCNGRYCYLNPRRGALIAVAESLRNIACSGAVPLGLTDNLNFGNPYRPESFYQLKEAVRGLSEACRFFDIPVVGGNVSLYNEAPEGAADPTPMVSIIGIIEDEKHITRQWAGGEGDKLVLLGGLPGEIGGSQYLSVVHGLRTGDAPALDLGSEERLLNTLRTLIRSGLVIGAHDLSEGGLMVALAEMLFAPDKTLGAKLDLSIAGGGRNDAVLFGESQCRVLLCVKPDHLGRVISEAHMQGISAAFIGEVTQDEQLALKTRSFNVLWPSSALRQAWENGLSSAMGG